MALLWFSAVVVVLFTGLLKFLLSFNTWKYEPLLKPGQAPLPPGSLGWPVFGNMASFLRAFKRGNPDSFIAHYIHKYGRLGVYKAFLFGQPTVLATTPESCKLVLSNSAVFKTGWPRGVIELIGPKSFAGISGDSHLKLRKLTEPLINGPKALEDYIPIITCNIRESLQRWASEERILLTDIRRVIFLTIHRVLFGVRYDLDVDETFNLYSGMNKGIRALPINIPGTAFYQAKKMRRKLVNIIHKVIDKRRSSGEKLTGKDTLSLLLQQRDTDGQPMEDAQIIDLLNMFMNAGHDSTAHAIMWMMIFVESHEEVLQKLKVEQLEIAKRKGGEMLTLTDIKSMHYLASVVDETLRLSNIAPMVFRKAMKDVEFSGFTIPKGWHAEAWLRQVHMDPCIHPEPHKFDPDRFLKHEIRPFTFIPFSMGQRTCPGNELAKLQMFIFMHYLVTGYEWKALNPGGEVEYLPHPRPNDLCPMQITKLKTDLEKL